MMRLHYSRNWPVFQRHTLRVIYQFWAILSARFKITVSLVYAPVAIIASAVGPASDLDLLIRSLLLTISHSLTA
jgi:hypothetical protein